MILADKITRMRKKNGWSQEELADKMNVSRQSVSKWEGTQSVPDLNKILQLSQLFGVTTDYLLKDELEYEEFTDESDDTMRIVTMEDTNEFLSLREKASKSIAFATFLCMISVIPLLIIGALIEKPYSLPEKISGYGIIAMFIIVAIAVTIYILTGSKSSKYEFLEKEEFKTEYGVNGMVKDHQEKFRDTYTKGNVIGTFLCITSVIPLFIGAIINEENTMFMVIMLSLMLLIASIGVILFIRVGVVWASYEKIICSGDFSSENKKKSKTSSPVTICYWLIATAVYLVASLTTNNWEETWIVWAVAGVLCYPVIHLITSIISGRKDKE